MIYFHETKKRILEFNIKREYDRNKVKKGKNYTRYTRQIILNLFQILIPDKKKKKSFNLALQQIYRADKYLIPLRSQFI